MRKDHLSLMNLNFFQIRCHHPDLFGAETLEDCEISIILTKHVNNVNKSQGCFIVANIPNEATKLILHKVILDRNRHKYTLHPYIHDEGANND